MMRREDSDSNHVTCSETATGRKPLNVESGAVKAHLEIMLDVIRRTAENSRSCKVWCVTIVSATLVLVSRTETSSHALLALAPTILFLILDTYYLALEHGFRGSYDTFVARLHGGRLYSDSLYSVTQCGSIYRRFITSFLSFSVWPFYMCVGATVLLAWLFLREI